MSAFQQTQPLFFAPNRVWRCYTGGLLLDEFLGNTPASDGHLPEDWLASCVQAINGPNTQGEEEGLSRVLLPDGTTGPLLREVIAMDPQRYLGSPGTVNFLCKYLDSAVRLPIQCHPDRELARQLYRSEHGKAESWLVLGTREINGDAPYLLMGFRPGISEEAFVRAVNDQDIAAMESMLHRIPVQAGDVYFIPGRFPHAIGPGVFMLEVQEPSDWVVQPEAYCAGTPLSDSDMWGPLEPAVALRCFAYEGESVDAMQARLRKRPQPVSVSLGGRLHRIIGEETTRCFGVDELLVESHFIPTVDAPYYLAVVTSGAGVINWESGSRAIRRGDVFFVPADMPVVEYDARGGALTLYLCLPGRPEKSG